MPITDLAQLEQFLAVAEELHFRRAAQRLDMPQPQLSRSIRRLERHLGVELFSRNRRRVRLTAAGRLLMEEAPALVRHAERLCRRTQLASSGLTGSLTIGCTLAAALAVLPRHLAAFEGEHPDVTVRVLEMSPPQEVEALEHYELDLAYTVPVEAPSLVSHHLVSVPYVVVVRDDHPWAARQEVPVSLLDGGPFVAFREESAPQFVAAMRAMFRRAGVKPRVTVEVSSSSSAFAFVRAGRGVAIVSSIYATNDPDIRFVPLDETDMTLQLVLIWRADEESPLVAAYVRTVTALASPA